MIMTMMKGGFWNLIQDALEMQILIKKIPTLIVSQDDSHYA